MEKVDCVVIGAGVIGLAVAARLSLAKREVLIIEKNKIIGSETSSRNSEVIHAGIYYPKNSLKALMCVQGRKLMYDFCDNHSIQYKQCGKVIVATNNKQLNTLQAYLKTASDNGVHDLRWLKKNEVKALEPEVECVGGILSPSTGILNSHDFMIKLQTITQNNGGIIAYNEEVKRIEFNPVAIVTKDYKLRANWIINCSGLNAPLLNPNLYNSQSIKPVFAKGHYFSYSGKSPFSRLIYPVAETGGLGVHVTLDIAGNARFGPDVHWINNIDYSFEDGKKEVFAKAIKKYFPNLDESRLDPSYTGIRPKIMFGDKIYPDFIINSEAKHGIKGLIDLLGIESPGLTSSLALANLVHSIID